MAEANVPSRGNAATLPPANWAMPAGRRSFGLHSVPVPVLVVALTLLLLAWAALIFVDPGLRLAIVAPHVQIGMEASGALARFFAALVLLLGARHQAARQRWASAGFIILGLGSLMFGYLPWIVDFGRDVNASAYAWLLVQTAAGALFALGFVPSAPPAFTRRTFVIILAALAPLCLGIIGGGKLLQPLLDTATLSAAATHREAPLHALTAWYWVIACVPLILAIATVIGAARRVQVGEFGSWILIAMVLLVGSQFHNMLWPTAFSPVLSTADILRFAFGTVVAIGGILELRRIADEHGALLHREQERSQHLDDLNNMKSTFTRMVAHELGSPVAAIRRYVDVLERDVVSKEDRLRLVAAIQSESAMLATLVSDVHTAATIERDDFTIHPRPVPLPSIVADAVLFARNLPGTHQICADAADPVSVCADRDRIGQVLRNLLSNAAKYSPDGTPIEIKTTNHGTRVQIDVVDRGSGIDPDDLPYVFDKFRRGRGHVGGGLSGLGLGLHISRRILDAHGSRLVAESSPDRGSRLSFSLEIVP